MDITTRNAVAAKFERRTRQFNVGIDAYISETVTVQAETIEEAKLKAKQIAKDRFDKDLGVHVKE